MDDGKRNMENFHGENLDTKKHKLKRQYYKILFADIKLFWTAVRKKSIPILNS